ncbi:GAF domain-containing protein, partial [candidate division KSB1 bacterium]|nr:GAF domain-containing protein [candidate division KSB1 bacterium]
IQTLGAERGFILLLEDDGSFSVRTARNIADNIAMDLTKISNSVVREALEENESVISYDVQSDDRFVGAESIVLQKIQSVTAVPLTLKQNAIGVIYLDSIHHRSGFTEASLPFLNAFAHQAAIAIENAKFYETLRQENRLLRQEIQGKNKFDKIIGNSPAMQQVFETMDNILNTDATVLIQGESGTGKELVARALHYNGLRKDKPFLALFCGALPESLLESELFGHKKGAFTGATSDKKGLFEAADGGTFLLDEVAELTPKIQIQLLRVLQEGEVKRIGETSIRKVNVRIIAATNKDLYEEMKKGNFREDLYYRLNVIPIKVPPLRERGKDITLLAHHFLDKYAARFNKSLKGFSQEAMQRIMSYPWHGNVRELENTLERAVVMSKDAMIQPADLQLPQNDLELPIGTTLKDFEKQFVLKTLKSTDNNVTETAKILDVSRRWLHYRLKDWGHEEN